MSKELTKPIEYLDESTGEIVKIPIELSRMHFRLHNHMEHDTIVKAFLWKWFRDTEGYRSFGCESFKEYSENYATLSYSTLNQYLKIGDEFYPQLSGTDIKELQAPAIEELVEGDETIQAIGRLGYEKLREISKMGDEKVNELIHKKQITFDDGTVVTYDEIEEATTRELKESFKEERERLKTEIKSLEDELDEVSRKKEKIEKDAQEGLNYKQKYEDTDRSHDLFEQRIQFADQKARELNKALHTIEGIPPDFDLLCKELEDLFGLIQRGLNHIQAKNPGVLTARRLRNEKDKDLEE